ncbi:hypothetical protein ACWCW7_35175 [Nocardia tengchongensis]
MILGGDYAIHLHADNGQLHSFLPGDALPDWAAARITNPNARSTAVAAAEEGETSTEGSAAPGEPISAGDMPPKKGPGASRQVWADYAESRGVAVEADWKREDIIAAVEALP